MQAHTAPQIQTPCVIGKTILLENMEMKTFVATYTHVYIALLY